MPLPASPKLPVRRSATIIYPAAFHPHRVETPQEWAAEAVRQHMAALSARGDWPSQRGDIAAPAAPLLARFNDTSGRFDRVGFGGGLAFAHPAAIVAPLPQPPRSWLSRLLGVAR